MIRGVVVPECEIRERGIRRIALPDAAAVRSFLQAEGVLDATSVAPDVSARWIANASTSRAFGAQTENVRAGFFVPSRQSLLAPSRRHWVK